MYHPPPRSRTILEGKRVLLIDRCQTTREVRAAVLRSRGVEVDNAEEFSAARFLWGPHVYDLVMLDVRRYSPGKTLEFYEQITEACPEQRFAFLTGAPKYMSLKWPDPAQTMGRDGKALLGRHLKASWDASLARVLDV